MSQDMSDALPRSGWPVRRTVCLTLILLFGALAAAGLVLARGAGVAPDTITPAARPTAAIDGARRFELPGRPVILNRLALSDAATEIEYDVIADERIEPKCAWYLIFDQDGRLLNIDYALSLSIDTHEESGRDTPVISLSVSGRALPDTVTSLRFVPVRALDRLDGETAEDYYQRMAALAADGECFTVSLDNLE